MTETRPAPGDLYRYFDEDERAYCVMKVLAVDESAIHVRAFDDTFTKPPAKIDTKKLDWSIGHVPLDPDAFRELRPEKVGRERVTKRELEGYEAWKEAGGGVFR